jgi:hypothetical protein
VERADWYVLYNILCTLSSTENKFIESFVHVFCVNFMVKLCKVPEISFGKGEFGYRFCYGHIRSQNIFLALPGSPVNQRIPCTPPASSLVQYSLLLLR